MTLAFGSLSVAIATAIDHAVELITGFTAASAAVFAPDADSNVAPEPIEVFAGAVAANG